jgi:hypothetical protein
MSAAQIREPTSARERVRKKERKKEKELTARAGGLEWYQHQSEGESRGNVEM